MLNSCPGDPGCGGSGSRHGGSGCRGPAAPPFLPAPLRRGARLPAVPSVPSACLCPQPVRQAWDFGGRPTGPSLSSRVWSDFTRPGQVTHKLTPQRGAGAKLTNETREKDLGGMCPTRGGAGRPPVPRPRRHPGQRPLLPAQGRPRRHVASWQRSRRAGTQPGRACRTPAPLAPGPPVMALRISRAASSRISMDACSLYQAACGVQIRLGASFRGPWLKLGQKAQSGHGLGAHPTVRPSGSPGPSQLPVD